MGIAPCCSRSSHARDPSGHPAKRYRISARTGWPGFSVLGLGVICIFCLNVTARTSVFANSSPEIHLDVAGT